MFTSNNFPGVSSSFDLMFTLFPIFFMIVFGIIVFGFIKGIAQWNKNNKSPVLTVDAKIVAKRSDVSYHHHNHGDNHAMNHTTSSTYYYVTFQVESGDRIELPVPSNEFGILVEGDVGRLTFQGTRFKGFQRNY